MFKAATVDDQGYKCTESGPQNEESPKASKTNPSSDSVNIDEEFKMQIDGISGKRAKPFDEETTQEIITKRVKNEFIESIHDSTAEQAHSSTRDNMREATKLLAYIKTLEETKAHIRNKALVPDLMTIKPALETADETGPMQRSWNMNVKRWRRIHESPRSNGFELIDDTQPIQGLWRYKQQENNHVLSSYREYEKESPHIHLGTTLEVNSPLLVASLQKAIDQYPGAAFQSLFSDIVAIPEPYVMLFHNRRKIQKEMEMAAGESKEHLQVLLSFLREHLPVASQKLDEIEDEKLVEIGYEEQWLLLSPGSVVYIREDDEWRAFKVRILRDYQRSANNLFSPVELECAFMCHDDRGRELVQLFSRYRLIPYIGNRLLEKLQFVPAEYLPDKEQVQESLVLRGRTYWSYRSEAHFREYCGDAWLNTQEAIRVMIDYSTSSKYEQRRHEKPTATPSQKSNGIMIGGGHYDLGVPGCECGACCIERRGDSPRDVLRRRDVLQHEYMQERVKNPESTPECFMFCPGLILAFSLKDKDWKPVKIHQLGPVSFEEDSFKKMVIKYSHRKVVIAMVRSYLSKERGFGDLIRGKGKGLVVLLHGSPGTGKTLTVECVAEKENRPLYMVTCGDLGTQPDVIEIRLKKIFEDAFNWNAILLLDEADVFLQERDIHDLKRNALVSIFLRHLEYFEGILFLTTNRPGALDEAFQSRIHITLGLPDLNVDSQIKVWKIFIRKLNIPKDQENAIKKLVTDDIKKHGNLNGRQIRNTIQAALALAFQSGTPINKEHIAEVLEIGRDFTNYMEDVNRMNQEQRAFALGHRKPLGAN